MAAIRDNLEDQDSSISSRANEVYSDAHDSARLKSFAEYLQTTPATPMSWELKALLCVVALCVALLFIGALLRIQRGPRRPRPARPPARASSLRPRKQGTIRGDASLSPAPPRMVPMNRI